MAAPSGGRLVSLKGIHNEELDLSKVAPKPLARPAPSGASDDSVRPVKVRRLDGREEEIDPTAGTTWVMPRMSHPEKLVSNKAEALKRFAERKAREGTPDPEVERRAAEAAAEMQAKQQAREAARLAELAARPKWRNVGPGRVVTLSGAEPTRVSAAAAPAAPDGPRLVRLGSKDAPPPMLAQPETRVGVQRRARQPASKPPVLSRLAQPAAGLAAAPSRDARALIGAKR
ncbi:hypothetical protein KFE25_010800 [Diacronema lutheri]|uniref:Uncharacterized protein n=1 Tax=Diacronema lutheri TaxID=2081491 RepID=A0A8J6C8L7_DIALT|nr:hypothetical protein KFE25_010800 [Diacronema lutheri]